MTNNLFVSFELNDPYRQGSLVLSAIEELGHAVRIYYSTWYVRSTLTASEAATRVWDVMDNADHLLVVNATHNDAAMFNISERASRFMTERWHLETLLRPPSRTPVTPMRQLEAGLTR